MSGLDSVVTSAAIRGAYQNIQDLKVSKGGDPAKQKTSFSELVGAAVSEAAETARQADQTAMAGLRGEVGTQQIVEATLELETTVRVAVSVRDKVVQAYQEILRMPI